MKTKENIEKKTLSKKRNTKTKKKNLWSYFAKHKWFVVTYILINVIYIGLGLLFSIKVADFLNTLADNSIDKSLYTLLFVAILAVGQVIITWLYSFMYMKFANKITLEIKKDLAHHILKINSSSMDHTESGVIINRIDNDPEDAMSAMCNFVYQISELISYILTSVYICILNWIVGLCVVAGIILMLIIEIIRTKILYKNEKKEKKLSEPATSLTAEMVRSQKDIKTLGLEEKFEQSLIEKYTKQKNMSTKTDIVDESLWDVREFLSDVIIYAIVFFALILLKQNIISLGVVLYLFTNRYAIGGLARFFGFAANSLTKFKVCNDRIAEFYDEEKYALENYGKKNVKNLKGNITFKNVAFSYVEKKEKKDENSNKKHKKKKEKEYEIIKHEVFKDLNFAIKANTTVAFIGKSGSGKSTILNLMAKLNDAEEGQILIDKYNIKSLSKKSLRGNMILINQFPYIFDMTIRENILLAKQDATEQEIIDACKQANLMEYINKLPNGLDTKIGENGVKMSGGQKQRLAIARALIKNTPIIIFDESTSSLDNEAQAEVTKSIQKLSGNHTVIIVAHRLSTIKNADTIYFLENGEIIDQGTFDYLNKNNKKFNTLFKAENLENKLKKLKKDE